MADNPRIDELRRRVQQDPASIAFAQLAEEYRRAGDHNEAVRVCRAGLEQHPSYLSARVTLGRALMEIGQYDEAQAQFEQVLLSAPDNLVALRSMAELHQRRETAPSDVVIPPPLPGATPTDLERAATAGDLAPTDIEIAPTDVELAPADVELAPTEIGSAPTNPVLEELEDWLAAIEADRAEREGRVGGSQDTFR